MRDSVAVTRDDRSEHGIDQLIGRIRSLRARQAELPPYSPDWYAAIDAETSAIDELKRRLGITDVTGLEWVLQQR